MKIAIVCDTLGEPNNGTTIAALNLISHLKSAGHEVRIVSPDESTRGKKGCYVVPHADLGRFLNKVLDKNGVCLARPVESIVSEALEGVDVVHVMFPFPLAWMAARMAHERGIPLTAGFHCQAENFTAHIGFMDSKLINHLTYKVFYRKVYRYCTRIHYPTGFIRDVFYSHTHCSVPAEVISNGVNEMFFLDTEKKRASDKFTVICSGRYSKEKAQHVLLKAVGGSKHRDEIKVVLAGSGPKEQKLRRLAAKLKIDCEMRFFKRSELGAYLRGADLYVHTAVAEIEAIACMEAIVSGLVPVICNSEGSATRFFAEDDRGLYKKGSAEDLRDKIDYFFENPEELKKYRRIYAEKARCFDQHECMCEMERMLKRAVSDGKAELLPCAGQEDDKPAEAYAG